MNVLKTILLGVLVLCLVVVSGVLALLYFGSTTYGTTALFSGLDFLVPGQLSVESLDGSLIGKLTLRNLTYRGAGTRITVERLVSRLKVNSLIFGILEWDELLLDGVRVETTVLDVRRRLGIPRRHKGFGGVTNRHSRHR